MNAGEIAADLARRRDEGVALLTERLGDGWQTYVDPTFLDQSDDEQCVLAQIDRALRAPPAPEGARPGTPFARALARLGILNHTVFVCGFGLEEAAFRENLPREQVWDLLTEAWRAYFNEWRRDHPAPAGADG